MSKDTNGSKASIREVYEISQRLETKIDKGFRSFDKRVSSLDKRFSSMEGKVSVIAVVWSSIIAITGIAVGIFIKK